MALMCIPAAIGRNRLIRDGHGRQVIGAMTAGAITGNPGIGEEGIIRRGAHSEEEPHSDIKV